MQMCACESERIKPMDYSLLQDYKQMKERELKMKYKPFVRHGITLVLVAILLLALSACVLKKHWNKTQQEQETAYFERKELWQEEYRIDTLQLALPEARLERCVPADSSVLETTLARSEARILPSGELYHSLSHSTQELSVELPLVNRQMRIDSLVHIKNAQEQGGELRVKSAPRTSLFLLLLVLFVVAWCVIRRKH